MVNMTVLLLALLYIPIYLLAESQTHIPLIKNHIFFSGYGEPAKLELGLQPASIELPRESVYHSGGGAGTAAAGYPPRGDTATLDRKRQKFADPYPLYDTCNRYKFKAWKLSFVKYVAGVETYQL